MVLEIGIHLGRVGHETTGRSNIAAPRCGTHAPLHIPLRQSNPVHCGSAKVSPVHGRMGEFDVLDMKLPLQASFDLNSDMDFELCPIVTGGVL